MIRLVGSVSVLATLTAGAGRPTFAADPDYLFDTWETEEGLPENSATAMAQTTDGYLWFGTFNGLVRFDGVKFTVFNPANTPALPSAAIVNLHRDRLDRLWVSTDRGLFHLGAAGSTHVPLPDTESAVISEDGLGYFWLTSNRGVVRAAQKDLHAVADGATAHLVSQLLDQNDVLPSAECPTGQPTCARDRTGRLWFATLKGVAMTDPAGFQLNALPPPVRIEQLTYHLRGARSANLNQLTAATSVPVEVHRRAPFPEPLRLPPGTHRLEIEYTALSYGSPQKIRFQTMLEGSRGDWEDAADPRVARFHELQPGHYAFHVRAANGDGVWNETGSRLAFTVQPYLWQTLWFKVVALVALGAVIYGSLHRRVSRLQQERATQQAFTRQLILAQENERKRVAAELHDGLGQDLLLIKNRLALASARQSDAAEHSRQLDAAAAATTRAISEVRAIAQALRPAVLDQAGLTKAIEWMVERLGEGSATQFAAELDPIDGLLAPEMETNLFRILQEGLNNITRHAGATRVILQVKREEAGLHVSLFDNGRGFEAEAMLKEPGSRRGLGLASIGERVKCLGGSLDLQSTPGRGTRLTVRVPLPPTRD